MERMNQLNSIWFFIFSLKVHIKCANSRSAWWAALKIIVEVEVKQVTAHLIWIIYSVKTENLIATCILVFFFWIPFKICSNLKVAVKVLDWPNQQQQQQTITKGLLSSFFRCFNTFHSISKRMEFAWLIGQVGDYKFTEWSNQGSFLDLQPLLSV